MILKVLLVYFFLSIPVIGVIIFLYFKNRSDIKAISTNNDNLSRYFEKELRQRTSEIKKTNQDLYRTNLLLTKEKEKSAAIIKYLGNGVIVTDNDGLITQANEIALNLLNCENEFIKNKPVTEVLNYAAYHEALQQSRNNPENKIETQIIVDKEDNTKKYLKINITRTMDKKGNAIGYINSIVDLTKEKELEHLKRNFIQTISHELRTPLTSIMGFLNLLKNENKGPLSDEQKSYVDVIMKASSHLKKLINDLLDVALMDSGNLKINLQKVNLHRTFQDITESFRAQANLKGLSLIYPEETGIPDIITDKDKIRQVFTNILSNAIKFTDEGYVKINFTTAEEYINVEIEDTGDGISDSEIEIIFERFRQLDVSSTRENEGMGIGLSIAKDLLDILGGQINVQSTKGKGSKFIFSLPVSNRKEVLEHEK